MYQFCIHKNNLHNLSCNRRSSYCGENKAVRRKLKSVQNQLQQKWQGKALCASRSLPTCFCSSSEAQRFPAKVVAILGMQWGDEGKGKLVDVLAQQYEFVCRGQGGGNAGHTIYDDNGVKYALHLVPSGILNMSATNVIGNGVVVHVPGLFEELDELEAKGVNYQDRLLISDRAHLLFDLHQELDGLREAELAGKKIGTTLRGIGPAYAQKVTRNNLRVGDLAGERGPFEDKLKTMTEDARKRFPSLKYDAEADAEKYWGKGDDGRSNYTTRMAPLIGDTVGTLHQALADGRRILLEGANATMLDIDFGTYPFVTSSNPSIGGMLTGLGLPPSSLEAVVGVVKAYTTRVGSGPYPTEASTTEVEEHLRGVGREFGTTTGRPRRVGWLDLVALNYALRINGVTHINLTKLDVLSGLDSLQLGVAYTFPDGTQTRTVPARVEDLEKASVEYETLPGWQEDISGIREFSNLPIAAQQYVQRVEQLTGVPVRWIGVGPERSALIEKL